MVSVLSTTAPQLDSAHVGTGSAAGFSTRLAGRAETRSMLELDGLRAVAVLAVAWSHWAPRDLLFGLPWGTGVQLFFVISGFLITGILLDNKPTEASPAASRRLWRNFYLRRALRIFPLFYLVLLVSWWFSVDPIESTWQWHAFYLSNVYYFLGNSRDAFLHFWSLSVEEQFYFIWPFLVLLLPARQLQTALILMIVAAPMFKSAVIATSGMEQVRYLPVSCLDALGIGALLASTARQPIQVRWNASAIGSVCLFLGLPVAVAVGALQAIASLPSWLDAIGHTGLVLFYGWIVIRAAEGFGGAVSAVLRFKPITYLGKISYGIYIYHFFAPRIVSALGIDSLHNGVTGRLAAYSIVTLVIAALSWHAFEAPINGLKRWVPYR